jgi:Glycosyl hydrolase family 115/Gylcosyl hydrolase family 115 C-terminal domain
MRLPTFTNRQRCVFAGLLFFALTTVAFADPPDQNWVHEHFTKGDFSLVAGAQAADILVSPNDFKVVQIAAQNLSEDIERVTGKKPAVRTDVSQLAHYSVIVGTLGKSAVVDSLISQGKLEVEEVRGRWETFAIATVPHPLPNVEMGLVIVGSDRRGTAFGVFELSKAIGVSPWYWWADVPPAHHNSLFVAAGTYREGPPSVQYRGIFLNDEDLGLQPWAAKTFDPELGDIGPKTYARVFELLLRLKANTLWPAMHGCTKAFNLYPQNKLIADDYAIVMGSSHAEPMLRNNVTEWTDKPENYDYTKNADGVRKYWDDRVAENGPYENIYTLGMRGIHDSPIQGPKTPAERIETIERIFAEQRSMLAQHVNPDASKVPQLFCPYKEVLTDYRNGLKVPDDVTIVWPDDNHGYIRYLPNAEERKRSGGFGIYYHISYLGGPLSYIWLDSTPPALIWEEMSKAFDNGVRRFWVLNVGDLKPGEISIDLFMKMGWNISDWRRENLEGYLTQWATQNFGARYAKETAAVMNDYYRLGFARKPEHLQWNLVNEEPKPSEVTWFDYGDEMQQRLDDYTSLMNRANSLYAEIPVSQRDAFYELVVYPARSAALANERYFSYEKSAAYLAQGRASAIDWARRAKEADAQMNNEAEYFNQKLAGGKWRRMITIEPPNGQWQNMRMTNPVPPASLAQTNFPEAAGLGVAIEGWAQPVRENERGASLPVCNRLLKDTRFIDVFNTGRTPAAWTAKTNAPWIKLSKSSGSLRDDSRIVVSIDWIKAPDGESTSGSIAIDGAGTSRVVNVPIFNPNISLQTSFVESNGVVSIEAEHFTNRDGRASVSWQVISGLGRTGDSVAIFPTTAASLDPARPARIRDDAPVLEYSIQMFTAGKVDVSCYLVPTHPIQAGHGLRYAIGFDDQPPQIVTVGADLQVPSRAWSMNVLNASTIGSSAHEITAGRHVLKLYMVDAGVVVDKIVVNTGGLRPSYLGPKETRVRN